jgi:DivIVA domain-containing protein
VRRKDKHQDDGPEAPQAAKPSTASAMITPLDIQQKEFQVSRLGGYRMRDVDQFLDQLTDAMTAVLGENERLRSGASGSPIVGSPDLDEVSRQADEIIQRARDEAARIVADANRRAASTAGQLASGAVTPEDRAAVDAFLARERAFLQSLASLVQEHADGVKGMAKEIRRRAASPEALAPSTASEPPSTAARAETSPASAGTAASEPATGERAEAPDAEAEPTRPITPVPPAKDDETIVVSEPEPAAVRREDEGDGDETLRELFWGEEG